MTKWKELIKKPNINLLLNITDSVEIKKNIHKYYECFKQEQISVNTASKEIIIAVIDYIKDNKIVKDLICNYQAILGRAFKDFRIDYQK